MGSREGPSHDRIRRGLPRAPPRSTARGVEARGGPRRVRRRTPTSRRGSTSRAGQGGSRGMDRVGREPRAAPESAQRFTVATGNPRASHRGPQAVHARLAPIRTHLLNAHSADLPMEAADDSPAAETRYRSRETRPRGPCLPCFASHKFVTDWFDATHPLRPDLCFRGPACSHWTGMDGVSNLCHVVPSDGPKMRTGASSGPSKRYWRAGVVVSLTAPTLTAFSYGPDPKPPLLTPDSRTSPANPHTAFTGYRNPAHRSPFGPMVQRSPGVPRPVRAPTGSRSGVPRGHQSSWPGSDS